MKEKNNIFYTAVGLVLAIGVLGLIFGLYKEIDKAEAQETEETNLFAGYVLSGYAWSENIGWISFNCKNNNSCETVDYKVKVNDDKTLSGYAWSENIGWISFNASDLGGCPSAPCNAKISDDNKNITGWARAIRPKNPENQTLGGWEGWIKLSDLNKGYKLEITEITPNPNSSVKKYQISGFVWGGGGNSRDSAVIGWTSFKGDTYGVVIEPEPTGEPSPTETTDGNGDCNQNQPSIEVSPSFQEGYRGNSLTYHLTITNNDSSDCLSSNFSSLITDNSIKTNSCLTYSPTKVFGPQKISPQNSVKTSFTVTIKDNCEEGRTYESEIETIKDTLSVNTLFKTKVLKPTISPPPSCFKCSFINNSNYYKLCNELTRLNIASGIVGANDWIYIKFPITDITSFTLTRDVGNIECRYINNSFDDSNKDCAFDKNNLGTAAVRAVAGRFSITLRVEYSNGDVCEENYEFNGYSGIGNAWRELPSF